MAVHTLDKVFRALAQRENIPTALVNLCLENVYAIESHEDLPDGSMTLICDQTTAVWTTEKSKESPGVGAFQAIIQLRPKDAPQRWVAPLLSPETESEVKEREAVDKWLEHVLKNHLGGQAEAQAKIEAGPVRRTQKYQFNPSTHRSL